MTEPDDHAELIARAAWSTLDHHPMFTSYDRQLEPIKEVLRTAARMGMETRDPWNPTSADLRFAADVLHAVIGEVEADTNEADTIEALRWEADRADAEELARTQYPHLSADKQARAAETFLATITARRFVAAGLAQED